MSESGFRDSNQFDSNANPNSTSIGPKTRAIYYISHILYRLLNMNLDAQIPDLVVILG